MRIIKHYNSHFPNRNIYKCTIRYTTKFGSLEEVTEWRDDQMQFESEYKRIEELTNKRAGLFYQTLTYKGD
jgi:hypothetical protein